MTDDIYQVQGPADIADTVDLSKGSRHRFGSVIALVSAWKRSLLFKIVIVFLGGILISYCIGALVGWSMFVDAAKEQWKNQAYINTQIASSTLRNIYTYVVIKTDPGGQVEKIVTAQPIGDDDSILFTGFTPTDVLALVAAQTKNDTWLFHFDPAEGYFTDVAASSGLSTAEGPWLKTDEPLFRDAVLAGRVSSGFATIAGTKYYLGLLPIMNADNSLLGVVAVSIGKASILNRAQDELIRNSLIMLLTILILTGLVATALARRLFRPVPALVQATLQIAGEVTDKVTPFQGRRDEIGDLARAIEALREAVVERARLREIRDMAVKLEHMAHHDALTGLANRALLMKTLDKALESMDQGGDFNILCSISTGSRWSTIRWGTAAATSC